VAAFNKDIKMTMRFGSKFVSLGLVVPFVALAACAPAPAKLLNPADQRILNIMVAPPVPCSDLKIELVNSYAGCESYGGMMDDGKFTTSSVYDADLVTIVDVRCYDLKPEKIDDYEVCALKIVLIPLTNDDEIPAQPAQPAQPAPPAQLTSDSAQNTAGTGQTEGTTTVTRGSDGSRSATAEAGNTSSRASSQPNSDGTQSVSAGGIRATRNSDGSFSDVSFDN
jgi:hypothetical protein